jgi:arsenite-transporting ATPase
MVRILVYTGKGGVGKTSIAAATAILCASRGYRTIVLSTDIAHSLADAFEIDLGPEPKELAPNLWAQEPDVYFNIGRYWRTIQDYIAELFSWHGLDEVLAEEMSVLPGMDELGNLLWIADHVDQGQFDVIVVDAAPTGETLRLLSLPEASRWWIERIAPIGRRVTRMGGPVIQRMLGVPMPRQEVFQAAERLIGRLDRLHKLLADPEQSTVRVVLSLDKLSMAEARRSFTYFHLFGYPSDLIIANRVLSKDAAGTFFASMQKAQEEYLPMLEQEFGPVPVRTVPWFDREMVGLERLQELGEALFGKGDPTETFYRGRPYEVVHDDGAYALKLELPFASRDEVRLSRTGDELILHVGAWRRSLVLPRVLINARTKGAKMDGNTLTIRFEAPGGRR